MAVVKVGIDIDGVCADFAPAANLWLAEDLGMEPAPIDRWDWFENYGHKGSRSWQRFWRFVAENPEWFMGLEPIEGAAREVDAIDGMGHEVIFVTARNARYQDVTWRWLEANDFHPDHLVHTSQKHEVGCDIYLDDSMDNIDLLRRNDKRAVLFMQPWNSEAWWSRMLRGVDFVTSIHGWEQFSWLLHRESELANA